MAFVADYEYDVFVSYASVDNLLFPHTKEGWITALVQYLKVLLAQRLGSADSYKLCVDCELPGNVQIGQEIMNILDSTATLIVILSRGYLSSPFYQKQRSHFLNMVKGCSRETSRVFVIKRDRLKAKEWPSEFGSLRGYQFWMTEHEGRAFRILGEPTLRKKDKPFYHEKLNELSYDLANELKELRAQPPNPPKHDNDRPSIFLADPSEDLEEVVEKEIKPYLDRANLHILPGTWQTYDPKKFEKLVCENLAKSSLFVQLLSKSPGKKPRDLPQGYVRFQYELARTTGTPILQWCPPDLDIDTIQDPGQHRLLQGKTVHAVNIEEFEQKIVTECLHMRIYGKGFRKPGK